MLTYPQALSHINRIRQTTHGPSDGYGEWLLSCVEEFSDRVGVSFYLLPLWIENEIRYYGVSPMRFSCGNDEHGCEREVEAYNGVAEGEPWWSEDEDEDRGEVVSLRAARGTWDYVRLCEIGDTGDVIEVWFGRLLDGAVGCGDLRRRTFV